MKRKIRLTEEDLRHIVKESVKRIMEARKPNDYQHGKYRLKGLRYDKNGNPIYTSDDIKTAEDIAKFKNAGWKMSKKHGLYGQGGASLGEW